MNITVNGVNLFYEVYGHGKELILLHGNEETHEIFLPIINELKKQYKIYAIDSRNHGKSEMTTIFDYEVMANDIKEFIEVLNINNPHLIGFSDGGIIGLHLSLSEVQIDKLVLMGVNTKTEGLLDSFIKEYKDDLSPYNQMMFNQKEITKSMLNKINNEVLVMFGDNDLIKKEHQTYINENIEKSKLIILKGHDHFSYLSDISDSLKIIKSFLK